MCKFQFVELLRNVPKAPLCKGGCQKSKIFDWGIVDFTIPPSKIEDFAHLPLHKGGLRLRRSICPINCNLAV